VNGRSVGVHVAPAQLDPVGTNEMGWRLDTREAGASRKNSPATVEAFLLVPKLWLRGSRDDSRCPA